MHGMCGLLQGDTQPFSSYKFEDFGRIGGKGTISTMSLSRVEFLNNEPVFCRAIPSIFNMLT